MRVGRSWVLLVALSAMLLLPLSQVISPEPAFHPGDTDTVYAHQEGRPVISFPNRTIEENGTGALYINLTNNLDGAFNFSYTLEMYQRGSYEEEWELSGPPGELPGFVPLDNLSAPKTLAYSEKTNRVQSAGTVEIGVGVSIPLFETGNELYGFYRVRVLLEWTDVVNNTTVEHTARSRGHLDEAGWEAATQRVQENPESEPFLVDEGGFTVVPEGYNYVRQPNRVPDLGNFTTPVIRPGETGTYNFTVTNRYDMSIAGAEIEVEFYMWATIEEAKPIGRVDGPPPRVKEARSSSVTVSLGDIPPQGSMPVKVEVATDKDTPKGTYFVRHRLTFSYDNVTFTMSSRGHYSRDQWEGFDYSNLHYQLDGSAGIIPDSSFSVKDPVPLWPLGTLIFLCVLFGALAVVFYLAEEHGERYPRLKKALQYWSGKLEQRRRLLEQRLDELRGEVDVPLEDDEA